MATYVNDLRLKEIATGDESGTWGTSTNTNLELIAEAFSFGTEAITTNADTHTTTIADGSTDPGRSLYLKYTGTLDSACTITIGPNTVSKLWFIENGTSGSQNIIISQGSGANITIPAGDVKVVYSDGAGSGAAVVDAFASLNVVDLKVQDDLTVTDDMTVGGTLGVTGILTCTDDIIIGDGKTIGSASDVDAMTIASNGQVTFTQTLIGTALDISGDIDVDGTTNLDVVDIDGAVDMASTLQVDGAITSSAGATITVADNSDNLTIVSTDADATTGPNVNFYRNSGSPADNDHLGEIRFTGRNDNSQDVIYSNIETRIKDASDGTEDGYFDFETMLNGTLQSRLLINEVATIVNEDSLDIDFRVESDGQTHALFVDAGNNKVGVNQSSPAAQLHATIEGTVPSISSNTVAVFNRNGGVSHEAYISIIGGTAGAAALHFGDSDNEDAGRIAYTHDSGGSDNMAFTVNTSEKMRIDSSGRLLLGTTTEGEASADNLTIEDTGSGGCGMTIRSGTAYEGKIFFSDGTSGTAEYQGYMIYNHSNNSLALGTATAERMRILSDGGVCIGGTAIQAVDSVSFANETNGVVFDNNTASSAGNGHEYQTFRRNSSQIGGITMNGTTGVSYNTSSDGRLKDITGEARGLEVINELNPVAYNWKADGRADEGLIAQEVQEIVPNALSQNSDGYYQMDYSKLVVHLVKGMKEQQEQIDALQSEINILKGE